MASRPRRVSGQLPKQDQSRAKWTTSLTKTLADLMVDQILKGNRQNNSFGKKAWKCICDDFYKKTGLRWDKDQLKNRYGAMRRQYVTVKSLLDQGDFSWDESGQTIVATDEAWDRYVKEHPDAESIRSSGCPIYKQLCTIFSESGVNGKYDQSSHCVELEGTPSCAEPLNASIDAGAQSAFIQEDSSSDSEDDADMADGQDKRQTMTPPGSGSRKRKRKRRGDVMVEAILEIAAATKVRAAAASQSRDRFSIANCVKALDELQGIDSQVYFAALDLFDNPNARETFISLKTDKRLPWLKSKCNLPASS